MTELTDLIHVVGGPGSGKGELVKLVKAEFGNLPIQIVSTSDLARRYDPEMAAVMAAGDPIPDERIYALLEQRVRWEGMILLDSLRTWEQCSFVDGFLSAATLQYVFVVATDPHVGVGRILEKRALEEGRTDDNKGALRKRLRHQMEHGARVLDFHREKCGDRYYWINGNLPLEEVQRETRVVFREIERSIVRRPVRQAVGAY